jgi:hypothetical protein
MLKQDHAWNPTQVVGRTITRVCDNAKGLVVGFDPVEVLWKIEYRTQGNNLPSYEIIPYDRLYRDKAYTGLPKVTIPAYVSEQEKAKEAIKAQNKARKAEVNSAKTVRISNTISVYPFHELTDEEKHKQRMKHNALYTVLFEHTEEGARLEAERQKAIRDAEEENTFSIQPSTNNTHKMYATKKIKTQTKHLENLEPLSFPAAMRSKDAEKWDAAMKKEIKSLEDMNCWTVVDPVAGVKPVPLKWVYKFKYNEDGSIEKYKARLVVRGDLQYDLIMNQIFSPVANATVARLLLSISCAEDWEIDFVDISNAFINASIEHQNVYVKPCQPMPELANGKWLKLKRALYGQRTSPRAWHSELTNYLRKQEFTSLLEDDCLFQKEFVTEDGKKTFVLALIYVDDIIIMSDNVKTKDEFKAKLLKAYPGTDKGPISMYLGNKIIRDRSNRILEINQGHYALEILKQADAYGLTKIYPTQLPMDQTLKLSKNEGEQVRGTEFRSLIGGLMYLCQWTRPDLAFSVSELAKYMSNPSQLHWDALHRVLRYLKGTFDLGIRFYGKNSQISYDGEIYFINKTPNTLSMFVDAAYANNVETRKSKTGWVAILNGGSISWKSKDQSLSALSSTDAEIYAACKAACEVKYVRIILYRLGFGPKVPTTIYEDNQATIFLAENPAIRDATKHMGVKKAYLKDMVDRNILQFRYITTSEQVADILTKPLTGPSFIKFRESMMHGIIYDDTKS